MMLTPIVNVNLALNKTWLFLSVFIIGFSLTADLVFSETKAGVALDSFSVRVKGDGNPVILIPGLMSDGSIWRDVEKHLARRYQVHTLSLAGFAGTPHIAEPSLTKVKKELMAYIEKESLLKPALIGHSLGGFLAMSLTIDAPDKFGPLVSVDGLPFIGPVFTQSNATTVASLSNQAIQMKNHVAQLSPEKLQEHVRIGVRRQATGQHNQALVIEMAGKSDPYTVAHMMYELMSMDLRSDLNFIEQPLLVIGASGAIPEAEQVHVQSLYAETLAAKPDTRLLMNRMSRHFVMLDQPEWLSKTLIEFLKETTL